MEFKIISIILLLIIIIIMKFKYKYLIKTKDLKLIQFYLDIKLTSRIILDNLLTKSHQEFFQILSDKIILYYNLEDIIITGPFSISSTRNDQSYNKEITKIIEKRFGQKELLLKDTPFINLDIEMNSKKLQIFIYPVKNLVSEGLILCIKDCSALLNEYELIGIENFINLMKSRLNQSV